MRASLATFRTLALAAACLTLVVVVLGAWVRLNAAGLGCPDWPGCYGHLTADGASRNLEAAAAAFPERPFDYAKAVKEMVHRYFASLLGLLILALAGVAIANRKNPRQPVALPIVLVGLVILQGLLGMWTVTLLLKPLIVVLHLLGGLAILSLLAWLAMKPRDDLHEVGNSSLLPLHRVEEANRGMEASLPGNGEAPSHSEFIAQSQPPLGAEGERRSALRKLAIAGLIVLIVQIALGGWTSSNYAALACPDFPTCQSEWWPKMDATEAFILWRGLGIDYEGGVLDHPARVAIHFVHRLGAIITALILGCLSLLAWRRGQTKRVQNAGMLVGAMLIVQLILGPLMVIEGLPLSLATAHNAIAALLLLAVVRLNRSLSRFDLSD